MPSRLSATSRPLDIESEARSFNSALTPISYFFEHYAYDSDSWTEEGSSGSSSRDISRRLSSTTTANTSESAVEVNSSTVEIDEEDDDEEEWDSDDDVIVCSFEEGHSFTSGSQVSINKEPTHLPTAQEQADPSRPSVTKGRPSEGISQPEKVKQHHPPSNVPLSLSTNENVVNTTRQQIGNISASAALGLPTLLNIFKQNGMLLRGSQIPWSLQVGFASAIRLRHNQSLTFSNLAPIAPVSQPTRTSEGVSFCSLDIPLDRSASKNG